MTTATNLKGELWEATTGRRKEKEVVFLLSLTEGGRSIWVMCACVQVSVQPVADRDPKQVLERNCILPLNTLRSNIPQRKSAWALCCFSLSNFPSFFFFFWLILPGTWWLTNIWVHYILPLQRRNHFHVIGFHQRTIETDTLPSWKVLLAQHKHVGGRQALIQHFI